MKKIWLTCLMVFTVILLLTSSNAFAQMNFDTNTTTDLTVLSSADANYDTYLPILLRDPKGFLLFPNGDFEQGPVIWQEYSTHGWELIVQELSPGVTPYEGKWAVWLGGDFNETSYIVQQVTVPIDLTFMSYWHWIVSNDDCGKDIATVFVNDAVVDTYSLCADNNTNGWVKKVVDLSAYAGKSVSVKIQAVCDATKNSNLFIDYVGFQTTAGQ